MLRTSIFVLSALLAACQPLSSVSDNTLLKLQLHFNGSPLNCGYNIINADQAWTLNQLQLYMSNFQLDGKPLLLDPTPAHQQSQLALLSLFCNEQNQQNLTLKFVRPLSSGMLQFTIGVPAARNHQNPLTAKSPLNQSDMFWSWQQGYKFLRLELDNAEQQWALHLGSTGCQSASPLRPPAKSCQQQNRPQISLQYQGEQNLVFDIAPLLDGMILSANNHCMSDLNRLSCQTLLPRLGVGDAPKGWSLK